MTFLADPYDGYSTEFDTMHEVYLQGATLQGEYGIPKLDGVSAYPTEYINIRDSVHTKRTKEVGVGFYMHDRYVESVWTDARRYVDTLQCFYCAFMPDFSIHTYMPKAMRIWNFYRNFTLASYFSDLGITVIPNLFCLEMDDNEWMSEYYPRHSTLAVSTKGRLRNKTDRAKFLAGLDFYVDKLSPKNIIMVGKVPEEFHEKVPTTYLDGDSEGAKKWEAVQKKLPEK